MDVVYSDLPGEEKQTGDTDRLEAVRTALYDADCKFQTRNLPSQTRRRTKQCPKPFRKVSWRWWNVPESLLILAHSKLSLFVEQSLCLGMGSCWGHQTHKPQPMSLVGVLWL